MTELDTNLPTEVPVLIAGGGPVGLSAAIFLAHHGVTSLLIEQHAGTSIYPKARFINARTMELFRQVGVERALRDVALPDARNALWAKSLAGEVTMSRPVETMIPEAVRDVSPAPGCSSTQDVFEPVLLAHAQGGPRAAAQVRFDAQLVGYEQRASEQALASILDRRTGRTHEVRARYVIGADGARSRLREILGIQMHGRPVLSNSVNILFRADLSPWTAGKSVNVCFITNPDAPGLLLHNGGDRWRFTAYYYPEKGEKPEDFTPERCQKLVRTAVGVPDLPVELGPTFAWSAALLVADRFAEGSAFLVGDAEHLMSPAGGFGMSVGIQSAHNLAWKLAAVLKGWAGPALLATYQSERAPITQQIADQMMRNDAAVRRKDEPQPGAPSAARPAPGRPEFFREHGLVFGATYESSAIVPDGTPAVPLENPTTDYIPNARPGSRAPHVWVERGGETISTLDVFDSGMVVLSGSEGGAWCDAAKEIATRGMPIQAFRVGRDADLVDREGAWEKAYGVERDGAVLVRPDGHVAWRCPTSIPHPKDELESVLSRVLGSAPGR
jgi:2-polyprenyl-6-methoxyphenol hydroxylase-like FAD-dependent oxidoreductase